MARGLVERFVAVAGAEDHREHRRIELDVEGRKSGLARTREVLDLSSGLEDLIDPFDPFMVSPAAGKDKPSGYAVVPLADISARREFWNRDLFKFLHPSSDRHRFTRNFLVVADVDVEGA
jgi:hypothetical protein